MEKSRYFLKRTKFALFTAVFPLILGFLLLVLSISLIIFNVWAESLDIDNTLLPMANNVPIFYDINGNKMEYKSDNILAPEEIPDNLKNAFVALEDKRFYDHNGYDTYRIAGAMAKNIAKGGAVEGASTITQQLVKNTLLTFEKTMTRKIKEIALAQNLEKKYSKDEILSMYLSVIYFGNGAYGVKSASKLYFEKDVQNLSLSECATLAGIIKNPTKYSPIHHPDNAKARRNVVLSVMRDEGYITSSQMIECTNEDMVIVENKNKDISKFFINKVIDEACKRLNLTKYQLDNSGLHIHTTYSPEFQEMLAQNGNLTNNFSRNDVANSSVIIDNKTGFVLAYTSSVGYEVYRQCGSTLKPIVVYAPAIEKDIIHLASPIDDSQIKIGDWIPKNYSDNYVGISNVRDAIKMSSNTVAVRVASYVGEKTMYQYGKQFGLNLTKKDQNLTLALGATEKGQTPLQVASAYSVIANNGEMKSSTFIRFVANNGKKIYSHPTITEQIISKESAFLLTDCLVDTVKNGTARSLSPLQFVVASKTGTVSTKTNENADAWNVSYNPRYTIAVWHGDTDETGGGHPTKHAYNIWNDLYNTSDKKDFPSNFQQPNAITKIPVDTYSTKKLMRISFATDNTPSKYCKYEYFKKSNQMNFETSLFENCNIDFNISAKTDDENVKITFWGEDIFVYKVIRKDILGERVIGIFDGNNAMTTMYDKPIIRGLKIEYKVVALVKDNASHIAGSKTKIIIA